MTTLAPNAAGLVVSMNIPPREMSFANAVVFSAIPFSEKVAGLLMGARA